MEQAAKDELRQLMAAGGLTARKSANAIRYLDDNGNDLHNIKAVERYLKGLDTVNRAAQAAHLIAPDLPPAEIIADLRERRTRTPSGPLDDYALGFALIGSALSNYKGSELTMRLPLSAKMGGDNTYKEYREKPPLILVVFSSGPLDYGEAASLAHSGRRAEEFIRGTGSSEVLLVFDEEEELQDVVWNEAVPLAAAVAIGCADAFNIDESHRHPLSPHPAVPHESATGAGRDEADARAPDHHDWAGMFQDPDLVNAAGIAVRDQGIDAWADTAEGTTLNITLPAEHADDKTFGGLDESAVGVLVSEDWRLVGIAHGVHVANKEATVDLHLSSIVRAQEPIDLHFVEPGAHSSLLRVSKPDFPMVYLDHAQVDWATGALGNRISSGDSDVENDL